MTLQPGQVVTLSPLVRRITAPNPGAFTGPGTNTYLIGHQSVCVLDPGPAIPEHARCILDAAGGCIARIVVTHTHSDHSPGVALLRKHCEGEVYGRTAKHPQFQDTSFQPDREGQHHDVIDTDEYNLKVIHTPGHASNHLCFLLQEEKMLFTGDHIMNGSTVVIPPHDGSMSEYLESLKLLKNYEVAKVAPGHGEIMDNLPGIVDGLIAHRLKREEKVHRVLQAMQPATLDELVISVYDDVDSGLHPIALSSLHSHLIRLADLGRAQEDGDHVWSAA